MKNSKKEQGKCPPIPFLTAFNGKETQLWYPHEPPFSLSKAKAKVLDFAL